MRSIRLNDLPAKLDNVNAVNEQGARFSADAEILLSKLSFSHLALLLPLKEPEKRSFYERQCVMGNWSVSELKRQINTLYYERSGMSLDPDELGRGVRKMRSGPALQTLSSRHSPLSFLG